MIMRALQYIKIYSKSSRSQSSRGSLFHSVGAATENDLSPEVRFVFRDGNASKMPADDECKL